MPSSTKSGLTAYAKVAMHSGLVLYQCNTLETQVRHFRPLTSAILQVRYKEEEDKAIKLNLWNHPVCQTNLIRHTDYFRGSRK